MRLCLIREKGYENIFFKFNFREQYTLQLLNKFKAKLDNLRSKSPHSDGESTSKGDADDEELNSDKWLV